MFDDVKITISNGMIVVTNKRTGAVIFTAPINDIPSGTFDDDHMPVPGSTPPPTTPPPSTVTAANVTASCTGCHGLTVNGTVLKSGGYTVTGRTAAAWLTTVNTMVGLGSKEIGVRNNCTELCGFPGKSRLINAASHGLHLHVCCMGCLPAEQHPDQKCSDHIARWLHGHAGHVSGLHLCTADPWCLHVYL